MSSFLPIDFKNYLLESLSTTERDRVIEFLEEITKSPSLKLSSPSGNAGSGASSTSDNSFGAGAPKGKKKDDKELSTNDVLFGDNDLGVGAAATAYGIGKAADTVADVLDATGAQRIGDVVGLSKWLPKGAGLMGDIAAGIASGAVSAIPGATSKLLRQVSDISGANWFDANIAKIGQSQMELAAQGAGSPWTALAVPRRGQSKQKPYDPNYKQNKAIEKAQKADQIKKLRKKGFNIP
jgi:hypothetical protein